MAPGLKMRLLGDRASRRPAWKDRAQEPRDAGQGLTVIVASLEHHGRDDELWRGHGRPPGLRRCRLFRETAFNYVLTSHTIPLPKVPLTRTNG